MVALKTSLTLMLITALLITPIVLFAQPATAASKPAIPEFTVKVIDASHQITTINPYTGQSETTLAENNSIEVTIKNQPVNTDTKLYYNIRFKPSFNDNWIEVYPPENRTSKVNDDGSYSYAFYLNRDTPTQSTSSFSTLAYPVVKTDLYGASGYDVQKYYSGYEGDSGEVFAFLYAIPAGGKVDVQVEAVVGVDAQYWAIEHPFKPNVGAHYAYAVALGDTSGWSSAQTVTIGSNSAPAAIANLLGSGQVNDWVIIVVAASAAIIAAAVAVILIKRVKTRTARPLR